jgi:hypothetical protein
MNSYTGAVYYAAAGLAPGLMAYRDLLFLHPQSIVRSGPAEEES